MSASDYRELEKLVYSLMLSPVSSDGSVSSFGLHDLAVRSDQLGRHQSERTEALRDDVRLNISIICFVLPSARVAFGTRVITDNSLEP